MAQTLRDLRSHFAQVENGFLRDPDFTPQQKALYSLLVTYGPDRIFPGHKKLAECMNVSPRSVARWLDDLRGCGLIDWKRRTGTSNSYSILGYANYLKLKAEGMTRVSGGIRHGCQEGYDTGVNLRITTKEEPIKKATEKAPVAPPRKMEPETPLAFVDGEKTATPQKQEQTEPPTPTSEIVTLPRPGPLQVARKTEEWQAKHSDLRYGAAIERLYTLLGRSTLSKKDKKQWDRKSEAAAKSIGGDGPPPTPEQMADAVTDFGKDTNNKWIYQGMMRRAGPHISGFEGFIAPYVDMRKTTQPTTVFGGAWG